MPVESSPGHGRSDKPIDPDDYSYLGHLERLEAFIQAQALNEGNLTLFVQEASHFLQDDGGAEIARRVNAFIAQSPIGSRATAARPTCRTAQT